MNESKNYEKNYNQNQNMKRNIKHMKNRKEILIQEELTPNDLNLSMSSCCESESEMMKSHEMSRNY